MPSYRKPNMAKLNSQVSKLKSANNQFERKANQAVRELKSIERKAKSYQSKLRSMSAPSLSTIPSLYLGSEYDEINSFLYDDYDKEYDVFISHASEDKEEVARPLAEALRKNGLSVWYDEFELKSAIAYVERLIKALQIAILGLL